MLKVQWRQQECGGLLMQERSREGNRRTRGNKKTKQVEVHRCWLMLAGTLPCDLFYSQFNCNGATVTKETSENFHITFNSSRYSFVGPGVVASAGLEQYRGSFPQDTGRPTSGDHLTGLFSPFKKGKKRKRNRKDTKF